MEKKGEKTVWGAQVFIIHFIACHEWTMSREALIVLKPCDMFILCIMYVKGVLREMELDLLVFQGTGEGASHKFEYAEGFGRQKDKTTVHVKFTSVLGSVTRTKRQFI